MCCCVSPTSPYKLLLTSCMLAVVLCCTALCRCWSGMASWQTGWSRHHRPSRQHTASAPHTTWCAAGWLCRCNKRCWLLMVCIGPQMLRLLPYALELTLAAGAACCKASYSCMRTCAVAPANAVGPCAAACYLRLQHPSVPCLHFPQSHARIFCYCFVQLIPALLDHPLSELAPVPCCCYYTAPSKFASTDSHAHTSCLVSCAAHPCAAGPPAV